MRKKDPESEVERKRQSYDSSVSKYSEAKRQQGRQGARERAKVVNLERRAQRKRVLDKQKMTALCSQMSDDEDDEEAMEDLVEEEDQLGEEGMDEAHDEMLQRFQDAKEDGDFPDEKDTPGDMTARVRFQR